MGYSIRREHVTHNLKMLKAIDEKVSEGGTFTLKPNRGKTPSQVAFKVRNMLKSAETFDEYGFSHLASQVTVSIKPKEVQIAPRYEFATPRVLSDLSAIERLSQETSDFLTLTFRLSGTIEDFASAIEEDWKITNVHENREEETVTVSFAREAPARADSPFSVISESESTDFDEYLERLMEEAEGWGGER